MKKLMLLGMFCLVLIAFASVGFAAPFLVSDPAAPADNVDLYQLELNGTVVGDFPPDASGTYGLKYDLSGLADGSYTARARVHNVWGWSNFSVPFDFEKGVPGEVVNIRLEVKP